MKRINLFAISIILIATAGNSAPKIAIMETALGNRAKVESLAQAKEAGYAGVQLHTGELDEAGVLTMAKPALIAALAEAREKTGIEIVSLCAGSMNKFSSWDPETRGISLSIGKQSIDACVALDTPMLLIPFFGKGWFGNDTRDEKFMAAVGLVKELSLYAEQKGVMLGIESNGMQATIDFLLEEVNSPYLKVYYDTGNLLRSGEDVYSVIKDWGAENICQIHLKPFNSEGAIFGNGETDLEKLRKSIEQSGYRDWLVFEAGPGKKTLGVPYAKKNLIGIMRMLGE